MKRQFFSLIAGLAVFFCVASSWATPEERAAPSLRDKLLMKHTLLTLWDMGYTSPGKMDPVNVCRMSLYFLLRGQPDSGEDREGNPARFTNIPERYQFFFSKELTERIALDVFGGWMEENAAPEGVFPGAGGYYIDMATFLAGRPWTEEADLPRYTEIVSLFPEKNGAVMLNGKLRRFHMTDDGDEVLWGAASFMARFSPSERGWKLESFVITEEAMG